MLKAVSIQAVGSIIAGLISFITIPIFAFYYGTSDIARLFVFLSAQNFVMSFSTFRFSLGIPLSKSKNSSNNLIVLSILTSLFISLLFFFIYLILQYLNIQTKLIISISSILVFLCLSVVCGAIIQVCIYKFLSEKKFFMKSFYNCLMPFLTLTMLLLVKDQQIDILYIYSVSYALTSIFGIFHIFTKNKMKISLTSLRRVAKIYNRLPKHLLSTSFLNSLSVVIMPLALYSYTDNLYVAFLFLTLSYIEKPISILTEVIWSSYYIKFGSLKIVSSSVKKSIYDLHLLASILYALPLMIVILTPEYVKMLFSEKWIDNTAIMICICMMVYVQYTSNIISFFQTFGKYQAESTFNILLFTLRAGILIIMISINGSGVATIASYCIASVLAYTSISLYWSTVFRSQFLFQRRLLFCSGFLLLLYYTSLLIEGYFYVAEILLALLVVLATMKSFKILTREGL